MFCEEQLAQKTKVWKGMERSTDEQRKLAEDYYKFEVMPIVIDCFLQKYQREESCESMVLTLGTSYEPLVLSILALKPKKVLILYTEQSFHLLDDVIEFTKLKPTQYKATEVDSESPLQLYQEIKKAYERWGRPEDIYVDFTGGTKSMAAGCAMAGSAIGAKLIYVPGKYLTHLRKPEPGTEKLFYVDDPYTVFGDIEREQAFCLFNEMDYISAYRIFDELENKVPGSKEDDAFKYLSKAYNGWDSLDISEAKLNLSKCYDIILKKGKLEKNLVLLQHEQKIKDQIEFLEVLEKLHCREKGDKKFIFNNIGYLIANLYQNAVRREAKERYEMATLLLYRILETIEQKRLWNYGIDTENADFSKLGYSDEELREKINDIRTKIKGFNEIEHLDKRVSLVAGYILLAAIGDDIIKNKKTAQLNRLKHKVDLRNKSIFAHGYEFIDKKKFKEFKDLVVEYMNLFFELENINKEKLLSVCEFIRL